jgi:hypothetical protein
MAIEDEKPKGTPKPPTGRMSQLPKLKPKEAAAPAKMSPAAIARAITTPQMKAIDLPLDSPAEPKPPQGDQKALALAEADLKQALAEVSLKPSPVPISKAITSPQMPVVDLPPSRRSGSQPAVRPEAKVSGQQQARISGPHPAIKPEAKTSGPHAVVRPEAKISGPHAVVRPEAKISGPHPAIKPEARIPEAKISTVVEMPAVGDPTLPLGYRVTEPLPAPEGATPVGPRPLQDDKVSTVVGVLPQTVPSAEAPSVSTVDDLQGVQDEVVEPVRPVDARKAAEQAARQRAQIIAAAIAGVVVLGIFLAALLKGERPSRFELQGLYVKTFEKPEKVDPSPLKVSFDLVLNEPCYRHSDDTCLTYNVTGEGYKGSFITYRGHEGWLLDPGPPKK